MRFFDGFAKSNDHACARTLMNRRPCRRLPFALLSLLALCISREAAAYPSSIVFAPTGEAKAFGDVAPLMYGAMSFTPTVGHSSTWLCLEAGVLPRFEYGSSGVSFGGLELGVNAIMSDLAGTPDAFIKPVFDLKLHLIAETGYVPHLAVGIMEVDPFHWNRSMNLTYVAVTKTIEVSGRNLGRLTLGFGGALGDFDDDPYRDTLPAFYATAPFPKTSRAVLIGGYESPTFGPFSLGIDHLGGASEVSSTNVALNFLPIEGTVIGLGGWFGSDPDAWVAGAFSYLLINFNVGKVFGAKDEEPAAPAPVTAQAFNAYTMGQAPLASRQVGAPH
jgi:hypothetical protein